MKKTKQGVPDLNARGHNGRRSASCAHHRAPDMTPTHVTTRIVHGDTGDYHDRDAIRTAYFTCCSLCGLELYEND